MAIDRRISPCPRCETGSLVALLELDGPETRCYACSYSGPTPPCPERVEPLDRRRYPPSLGEERPGDLVPQASQRDPIETPKVCQWCERSFTPRSGLAIYCSRAHGQLDRRRKLKEDPSDAGRTVAAPGAGEFLCNGLKV